MHSNACLPGYFVRQAAAAADGADERSKPTMRFYCDKCPVGWISTGGPFAANPQCHPCPTGSSTAVAGSRLCDVCLLGYAGIRCLPCAKGFYGGGGNVSTALKCTPCPPGYTTATTGATTLQQRVPTSDPCAGKTCNRHGSCSAGRCSCVGGWTGENYPCVGRTCSFHGVCEAGACSCDPFWAGTNCEIPDPCMNKDCSFHGQCSKGVCKCDLGWTGANCQTEATIAIIPTEGGSASIPGVVSVTAPAGTFIDGSHSVNAVMAFASTVSIAAPLVGAAHALYGISAYSTNMVTITVKENTQPTKPFTVTLFTGDGNPWTNTTKLAAADQLSVMYLNDWNPSADGINGRFTVEVLLVASGVVASSAASISVELPAHAFRRVLSGTNVQYIANVMLAASSSPWASARRRSLLAEEDLELDLALLPGTQAAAAANAQEEHTQAGNTAAALSTALCQGWPIVLPFGPNVSFTTLAGFGETVVASNSSTGNDMQFLPGPDLVPAILEVFAAHTGQVYDIAEHPYLGRYIVLQSDPIRPGGTLYAPVAAAAGVAVGTKLAAGDKLGTLLPTADGSKPALHFVYAVPVAPATAYTAVDPSGCFLAPLWH
ncbi:hypothetical protein OEZ86_006882 [Tetradesmus obliquus]|nr:hypothetical protein OEZ86_006882 [Tetradesmus obliquus]